MLRNFIKVINILVKPQEYSFHVCVQLKMYKSVQRGQSVQKIWDISFPFSWWITVSSFKDNHICFRISFENGVIDIALDEFPYLQAWTNNFE